jgi:hypothetical protein
MAATGSKRNKVEVKGIPARLAELGKLGLGTMTHPEIACWVARVILFERMEKMLGEDLRDLRKSALPLYVALYARGRQMLPGDHSDFPVLVIRDVLADNSERTRRHSVESWSSLCEAAEHFPVAKRLVTAVSLWSEARRMTADWFLDSILGNLRVWRIRGKVEPLPWSYRGGLAGGEHRRVGPDAQRVHGWGTLDHVIPVPVVTPYNPTAQTREEHKLELQSDLEGYYAAQEALFAAEGFQRTVRKRKRAGTDLWLHVEWFIEHQMRGRSGSEIAEKYQREQGITVDAILRAVRELVSTLEGPPRSSLKADLKGRLKKKTLNS